MTPFGGKLAGIVFSVIGAGISLTLHASTDGDVTAGRQLFQKGKKINQEDLTANVGRASIPVPASTLPCMGCHGRDGKGRPEGGVIPSNINWNELSKSYGGVSASGRKYGTYDESKFLRAVTEGIDAAGNKLDASMPRYNISRHDARDLIAYLRHIQDDYDPGIHGNKVVFSTLQPKSGWEAKAGEAIVSTIRAYFDDINKSGGVYGRKLTLKVSNYTDGLSFRNQADTVVDDNNVFALVGSFTGQYDKSLTRAVEKSRIPSISPFTNHLSADGKKDRYTFYLYGGLDTQIAVLAKQLKDNLAGKESVLLFYSKQGEFGPSVDKAMNKLKLLGVDDVHEVVYEAGNNKWLESVKAVGNGKMHMLFIGKTDELLAMSADMQSLNVSRIYMPGLFVSSKILQLSGPLSEALVLSYSTVPSAGSGLREFREFIGRHKFDSRGLPVRLFAYGSARLVVEGLKRAGKRLSREKVITALESLQKFNSGLNRPLSYDASKRIGQHGAYLVTVNKSTKQLQSGKWVSLD